MKHIFKVVTLLALLVAMGSTGWGQTALTQTTLSAAVNGGSIYSGGSSSVDTTIPLTSTTGVTAAVNNVPQTFLYVDAELMAVVTVNTTTKIATVIRGVEGTFAAGHASLAMVLAGPNGAFQKVDPQGACTAAATAFTPWVNILSGKQWLCSTVTLSWVPGWGNPGDSAHPPGPTTVVASAAGLVTPSGPLFHVTGTAAITGFNIPVGFNGGGFCAIADSGIWTWTAANNITIGGTVTAADGRTVCFVFDSVTLKFSPNRIT